MSIKTVIWPSDSCLPCQCQGTVNVFLLLKTGEIVAAQLVATNGGPTCSKAKYQYTFEYDSLNLPEGYTILSSTNIDGAMCEGVFSAYVANYVDQNVGLFLPYGTYTPTAVAVNNVDAITPALFFYHKIGNQIHLQGTMAVDPTAAGAIACQIGLSLPPDFLSTFTDDEQASGVVASSTGNIIAGGVYADTDNSRLMVQWVNPTETDQVTIYVQASYLIL